jgi:hypothetical protein
MFIYDIVITALCSTIMLGIVPLLATRLSNGVHMSARHVSLGANAERMTATGLEAVPHAMEAPMPSPDGSGRMIGGGGGSQRGGRASDFGDFREVLGPLVSSGVAVARYGTSMLSSRGGGAEALRAAVRGPSSDAVSQIPESAYGHGASQAASGEASIPTLGAAGARTETDQMAFSRELGAGAASETAHDIAERRGNGQRAGDTVAVPADEPVPQYASLIAAPQSAAARVENLKAPPPVAPAPAASGSAVDQDPKVSVAKPAAEEAPPWASIVR